MFILYYEDQILGKSKSFDRIMQMIYDNLSAGYGVKKLGIVHTETGMHFKISWGK